MVASVSGKYFYLVLFEICFSSELIRMICDVFSKHFSLKIQVPFSFSEISIEGKYPVL